MRENHKAKQSPAHTTLTDVFGLSPIAASITIVLTISALVVAIFWFFHSAPPKVVVMTSGPEDSSFRKNAEKYQKILKRNGVNLEILPSEGSLENLKRLANPAFRVDVGFVEGGEAVGVDTDKLVSLGSLNNQPLVVFYRGARRMDLLSEFEGKSIAIGPAGSGTNAMALALLAVNGIKPGGKTKLVELDAQEGAKALLDGKIQVAFMMGDSTPIEVIGKLMRTPRIHLFNFTQADAYARRITYLNRLDLPRGAIDFAKDIPSHDVALIGPTVELVARENLHPAISDLLLEAAHEIHGNAGLFKRQGEFPSPQTHDFRLSPDAMRFYKSGKSFLYRSLPFGLASLANRILVVFVPLVVVLIPLIKSIPAIYRWRINLTIYRWYRALLQLERDMLAQLTPGSRQELMDRLAKIETAVNKMKVPAPFAGQFYELRGHIGFVRSQLDR